MLAENLSVVFQVALDLILVITEIRKPSAALRFWCPRTYSMFWFGCRLQVGSIFGGIFDWFLMRQLFLSQRPIRHTFEWIISLKPLGCSFTLILSKFLRIGTYSIYWDEGLFQWPWIHTSFRALSGAGFFKPLTHSLLISGKIFLQVCAFVFPDLREGGELFGSCSAGVF